MTNAVILFIANKQVEITFCISFKIYCFNSFIKLDKFCILIKFANLIFSEYDIKHADHNKPSQQLIFCRISVDLGKSYIFYL